MDVDYVYNPYRMHFFVVVPDNTMDPYNRFTTYSEDFVVEHPFLQIIQFGTQMHIE